jgi:gamma-glutamyltranspeptidase/glutathione hydrolase/leukotriene-C4 hydrolase
VENLENGAVATDDGRCSDLGKHILAELGGNAIDAAVAVTLCLGCVNPAGSTPGGGAVRFVCVYHSLWACSFAQAINY